MSRTNYQAVSKNFLRLDINPDNRHIHSNIVPEGVLQMNNSDSCFSEDLNPVITLMKNALGDILYSLDISLDHPKDVYKKLKIDKKLGWKIYNVACEVDPFIAAQFVPGKAACTTFMKSCRKQGTPKKLLQKAFESCLLSPAS